ncbi:MAG: flagellar basal body protein [Proteobacteria bacterium]|nr:flagellar basal body protein [Pseudomonadota bacterium]
MSAGVSTLDLMRARLQWLERRQGVLAGNVANADTPGYRAKDVTPFALPQPVQGQGQVTTPGHIPIAGIGAAGTVDAARIETRPNGNAVSLEDEMLRLAEVQVEHQTLVGLYQRSLAHLKTAIGKRA